MEENNIGRRLVCVIMRARVVGHRMAVGGAIVQGPKLTSACRLRGKLSGRWWFFHCSLRGDLTFRHCTKMIDSLQEAGSDENEIDSGSTDVSERSGASKNDKAKERCLAEGDEGNGQLFNTLRSKRMTVCPHSEERSFGEPFHQSGWPRDEHVCQHVPETFVISQAVR